MFSMEEDDLPHAVAVQVEGRGVMVMECAVR